MTLAQHLRWYALYAVEQKARRIEEYGLAAWAHNERHKLPMPAPELADTALDVLADLYLATCACPLVDANDGSMKRLVGTLDTAKRLLRKQGRL